MSGFVYEWTNQINGKKYIGSHKGDPLDGYVGSGLIFSNAIKKYGIENFTRRILYIGDFYREEEERILIEIDAAASENYYNMKNQSLGGTFFGEANGMYNKKMSDESKKKISNTLKAKYKDGLKKTNSEKIKGSKNPMFGKNDHCKKVVEKSKSNTGKSYEEIHGTDKAQMLREKLSKSQTGKKHKLRTLICPHCNKEGSGPNMSRYHFEKCKFKKERTL